MDLQEHAAARLKLLLRRAAARPQRAAAADGGPFGLLGLGEPADLSVCLVDSTCLEANVHFPVDWVLLRDVSLTMLKAVKLVRRRGLLNRMPETPESLAREMNKMCIEMTHSGHKPGSRKARKKVLRRMKRLLKKVGKHARRHRDLLDEGFARTDLSRALDVDDEIEAVAGDRSFDARKSAASLEEEGIVSMVCPKDPDTLKERHSDPDFARWQRRRGSTEARIAILKNHGCGRVWRAKGLESRRVAVGWSVLQHNLLRVAWLAGESERQQAPPAAA